MKVVDNPAIQFSFGKNWKSFVGTISEEAIVAARSDIADWLGEEGVAGKSVVDIGCGSGIHSLCFFLMDAKEIVSFDVDEYSLHATEVLWQKADKPSNWRLLHGSILNDRFVSTLGTFDIAYAWGSLHHTGAMWDAINNACKLVRSRGFLWLALYVKGPKYPEHLALKQSFNRASWAGKKLIIARKIWLLMKDRLRNHQNPLKWNVKHSRGMNTYHDLVDWLGGLPYEVAAKDEVEEFCARQGFKMLKVREAPEGSNNIFLLQRLFPD